MISKTNNIDSIFIEVSFLVQICLLFYCRQFFFFAKISETVLFQQNIQIALSKY